VDDVVNELKKSGIESVVYDKSQPNPSDKDVKGIANAYFDGKCVSVIGVGGGGPLDATKAAMGLVSWKKLDSKFDINKDGTDFIVSKLPKMISEGKITEQFSKNIPYIVGIPTTAGTGSEGGKSSVITKPDGSKIVFGHPAFFFKTVALVPQFTVKLPPLLTSATGIDALFHLMEAYFVPLQDAYDEGMIKEDIDKCEEYALYGIDLVVKYLPEAYANGNNLDARLNMLIAALYGAKAFRKGSLGSIHACAHSLGAYYHLHHGTCIARMAVPVLKYDESKITNLEKFNIVNQIFQKYGYKEKSLSANVEKFFKKFDIPIGLSGLKPKNKTTDLEKLIDMATNDGCQTNPIRLNREDYKKIFTELANKAWK